MQTALNTLEYTNCMEWSTDTSGHTCPSDRYINWHCSMHAMLAHVWLATYMSRWTIKGAMLLKVCRIVLGLLKFSAAKVAKVKRYDDELESNPQ